MPQFLLDTYIQKNQGADCNIIITQPRRISATSLSVRVASERNENVRPHVKYFFLNFILRPKNVLPFFFFFFSWDSVSAIMLDLVHIIPRNRVPLCSYQLEFFCSVYWEIQVYT